MTPEPPTLGEVIRRVDKIEGRQDRAQDIYLRKDVYDADRRADAASWADHEKDHTVLDARMSSDAAFRRQVLLWGAGLTISSLVSVGLYILTIILGKV